MHRGHLQEELQPLADGDHGQLVERLGAVTRLEQEGAAVGCFTEGLPEGACLAREDQGRQRLKPFANGGERCRVRPLGLLERREPVPGGGRPGGVGHGHRPSVDARRFDAAPENG